ncbi:MAG: hypothetical protein ACHQ1H_13590 [Nitrososphaerales archaeon]
MFYKNCLLNKQESQKQEVREATATNTILDLDLKQILASIQKKYGLKMPKRVVAVDYDEKGDLCIRFKHTEAPQGGPASDGRVIFFYDGRNKRDPVAVEILDVESFTE